MNIQFRNSVVFLDQSPVQWIDGELVEDNTAIVNAAGLYLSIQPNGTQETRDVKGPWEVCSVNGANNTVTYAGTGIAFVLPIRGR